LFDPACLPLPVLRRLAVIGYWVCSPDVRAKVDDWDELDAWRRGAVEGDLGRHDDARSSRRTISS
jgi:hypothetical protein